MKTITAVLIGAGGRGADAYASYALAHPNEFKVTAVCEPDPKRREKLRLSHKLDGNACFASWEDIVSLPKLADTAMICTQDNMHFEPAMKLMEKGYDLLLEKPMSNNPRECLEIARRADQLGRKVVVCHVLRYTPFFTHIKKLLEADKVGRIINIQHSENIAYWHYAMSYVRGAWRRDDLSSPMILAKCCHDMDIFNWLLEDRCVKVSSFGSLAFFREENAPPGAPERCQDGCPAYMDCPWYAPRFYLNHPRFLWLATGADAGDDNETRLKALHESRHGRCVFRCDNNVADHQVTLLEYSQGAHIAFTVSAFTHDNSRVIRIMGTKGNIIGDMDKDSIEVYDYLSGTSETVKLAKPCGDAHFGGDEKLMQDFVQVMQSHYGGESRSSASVSVQSHMMAFAAEKARLEGKVVDMDDFCKGLEGSRK